MACSGTPHSPQELNLPAAAGYQIISKNTFVDVVDISEQRSMRRSKSDSSISSSGSLSATQEDGSGEAKKEQWLRTAAAERKMQKSQRKARDAAATTPNDAAPVTPSAASPMQGAVPGQPGVVYAPVQFMAVPMPAQAVQSMPVVYTGITPASSSNSLQNMATVGKTCDAVDSLVEQLHRETKVSISELQDYFEKGILQKVPRNDKGDITSIGSIGHAAGTCTNCLFWFRGACAKGITCEYCHFKHKGQQNKRIRPSKRTREQQGEKATVTSQTPST